MKLKDFITLAKYITLLTLFGRATMLLVIFLVKLTITQK